MDRALAEIHRVGLAALGQAAAAAGEVVAVVAGLAGALRPAVQRAVADAARDWFPAARSVTVTHDARIALHAAAGGAPGVVLVAGTGSVAYGMDAEGREARAGGWGYLLGDEGSAYDLGRRGLAAVLRAHDGTGPPTALRDVLLARLQVQDAEAVLERVYPVPGEAVVPARDARELLAALAGAVLATAQRGDPVAVRIVDEAAAGLAALVVAVGRRLRFSQPVPVYAFGGLIALEHGCLLKAVRRHLADVGAPGRFLVRRPRLPPVAGAVRMALEQYLGPAAGPALKRLQAAVRRTGRF